LPEKVKVPLGLAFFAFLFFIAAKKQGCGPRALRGKSIDGKGIKARRAAVFPQDDAGLSGTRPGNARNSKRLLPVCRKVKRTRGVGH
jgi:hypothetical protein